MNKQGNLAVGDDYQGETETLVGGICDGLLSRKIDGDFLYGGIIGDGKVRTYNRRADGKLHYLKTQTSEEFAAEHNLKKPFCTIQFTVSR